MPSLLATLPAVPLPDLPPMPAIPAPPAMTGEVFSTMVHSGPGGSELRDAAARTRSQVVSDLRSQADQLIGTGASIDGNWQDGGLHHAGRNTVRYGHWLHSVADEAATLAATYDELADDHDAARNNTPPPEEFQRGRQALLHAHARIDPVDETTGLGFGWDKSYWKHHVTNPNVFTDLISHSRPISNDNGTLVYEVPIERSTCSPGLFGGCENTGESVTMRIVANINEGRFDIPDGGQKGVITMFPLPGGSGVVEVAPNWTLTPPWVNNNVPIN